MRKLLLILILCVPGFTGFIPDESLKSERTNGPPGFIDITVFSNIDKQFFQYILKQQCLPFTGGYKTGYALDTSFTRIVIPVKEFRCTNKSAYKDFLKLLKAEQYPNLEIYIPHYSNVNNDKKDSVVLKGVSIIVAGVTKRYDINCKIDKSGNDNKILNGTTGIKLTDLDIVPPVKLFGIVKVKNEISIDFEFCVK
ncbi:MAG: hypothetical protein LLG13_12495 [Bacteroidales bacterium]|nr:hypothetical protein [Bacteroidales bacterium]